MQGSQLDVLQGCLKALNEGQKVTLVSVAKTWGTSPRPVGSLLAVTSNGQFYGSVSGGCIEEDLIERLTENPCDKPQLIMYGETEQQRHHFGLPCGGVLQLIIEPFNDKATVTGLIKQIQGRNAVSRCVELNTLNSQQSKWQSKDEIGLEGNTWRNVFGPTWRLLIVGAGETGQFLAQMAQGLGYEVLISDPRPDYRNNWPLPQFSLLEGFPDDIISAMKIDDRTAIVAVAHDPKVDDMALLSALRSDAFYVGALGSKQNNHNRRERLKQHFGFSPKEVARLHGPVGIYIGSKTPAEIALSILAEITAIKNGATPASRSQNISQSACTV